MRTARVLGRYLGRYRGRYVGGFALLLATTACALMIPWVIKWTIEAITARASSRTVLAGAAVIVVLAVLQGVTRAGSRFALLGASQRVEADIRDDLFRRLLALPAVFYQQHRTGDLMSRATNDLHGVSMLIGFGLLSLVSTALILTGTLAAMLRLDVWLTVATLGPTPLLIVLAKRFNSRAHGASLAVQEQLSRLSEKVQENLTGMAVVRAYTMEAREISDFRRLNDEYLALTLRQARIEGTFSPLMGIIGGLGTLIVVWLGGRAVIDGRISLGELVAFASYLAYLTWPILALGWVLAVSRRGLSSMERIIEVLETEPAVRDAPDVLEPDALAGDIELRHLTFGYEPARAPALQDVSLRVPAGTALALVGPTGAGKSTLAALLVRLWDPPRGTVFIDGREIHTIPLATLRQAIGYVPQEAFLFSRSLRENIDLGGGDGRLLWAGETAGLTEDVSGFPDRWETVVGERGITLSGGQRQRTALARALARVPAILVLDDAFASIDAAKESEILGRLAPTLRGRTTLLITHRLRAARLADRVVVLDHGRVAESGTHDALMAREGLYARLWRRQELQARLEAIQ